MCSSSYFPIHSTPKFVPLVRSMLILAAICSQSLAATWPENIYIAHCKGKYFSKLRRVLETVQSEVSLLITLVFSYSSCVAELSLGEGVDPMLPRRQTAVAWNRGNPTQAAVEAKSNALLVLSLHRAMDEATKQYQSFRNCHCCTSLIDLHWWLNWFWTLGGQV